LQFTASVANIRRFGKESTFFFLEISTYISTTGTKFAVTVMTSRLVTNRGFCTCKTIGAVIESFAIRANSFKNDMILNFF